MRVAESMRKLLEVADVVLTVGGVSAGDFDPVKLALSEVGEIALASVYFRAWANGFISPTLFTAYLTVLAYLALILTHRQIFESRPRSVYRRTSFGTA